MIGQRDVQGGKGPALAEEVQNQQEALIGQTLAENPSRRSSLREWYHKTAKASCRDAERSHTVFDVPPGNATDSHTANSTQAITIESGPNVAADFPYSAYLHPPSSALQDPLIHDTQEAIPTNTPNEAACFPYYSYLHPPSSALQEPAISGAKQSDMELEIPDQDSTSKEAQSSPINCSKNTSNDEAWEGIQEENQELGTADQDTNEETGCGPGGCSKGTFEEEDWQNIQEGNEELDIVEQNSNTEIESNEGDSAESPSDDENWETDMLEKDDDMNTRHSTSDEPDDEDMLDAVEEQQHLSQRLPPSQSSVSTPCPNSSKRQRTIRGHKSIKHPSTDASTPIGQYLPELLLHHQLLPLRLQNNLTN